MNKYKSQEEEWTSLRLGLSQSYEFSNSWKQSIDLFKKRISDRYLNPIEKLIKQDLKEGEGFTILTVQCTLIEMFAAFRIGKIHNNKNGCLDKYEYRSSKRVFIDFLHIAKIFEGIFWTQPKNQRKRKSEPYDASLFYEEVRCGLIHEARTKGKWLINAPYTKANARKATVFIEPVGDDFKIYRTVLHYRLENYLNEYSEILMLENRKGENSRRNFARKMDHLFGYTAIDNVEWWQ